MNNGVYFSAVKRDRGNYFVEYKPPWPDGEHACLDLSFSGEVEPVGLDRLMETEVRSWLATYPVPIMAWAHDSTESTVKPAGRPGTCLVGWVGDDGKPVLSWEIAELTAHLKSARPIIDYKTVFAGLPFKTGTERKVAIDGARVKTIRQYKTVKIMLIGWLVVIPAAWAIIQLFGPYWLGVAVTIYSLRQAWLTYRRITGRHEPSVKEIEAAETQRLKDHYFYHCKRNPVGFERLKLENFDAEARERVKAEHRQVAEAAKADQPASGADGRTSRGD